MRTAIPARLLVIRILRCILPTIFLFLGSLGLLAQENRPPGQPGDILISDITAHSARIGWEEAIEPDGDSVFYHVWLRKRIEGIAQPWLPPHETRATYLVWDGLSAGTLYEVKVAAADGKVFGLARIRENAFKTLAETDGNSPPTTPPGMEFTEIRPHAVKIWWGASSDANGDPITYQVSLRKRVEGEVFAWLPPQTAVATSLRWEGLEAETQYDAWMRATDGKSVSRWFLKERAFRTPPELNAPSRPGEISVSQVTANSARVAWGTAGGPPGVALVYEVQVRGRVEEVLQEWKTKAETTGLFVVAGNLRPATSYDVRIRAWAQGVVGAWALKDQAFVTLALNEVNRPPSRPGPLEISELTPFSVRLGWGPSTDPDGDRVIYAISLRKRIEGVAQAWSPARETVRPWIIWEGLTPDTIYEVRIRAWDGKVFGEWYVKEHAFQTPKQGEKLISFVRHPDANVIHGQRTMLLIWPDNAEERIIETAETVGIWTPCLEVMTDGTNNRAEIPMSAEARFFRVRE